MHVMSRSSRLAGAVAAVAVAVVVVPLATAQSASADATFRTWGTGINVREDAKVASKAVTTLPGPTDIVVDCQKQGDVVTDGEASSAWWAHVPALGGYVSVVYVDIPENKLPGVGECTNTPPPPPPPPGPDVTIDELRGIYGALGDEGVINEGLGSLNAEMKNAGINTPARKAAFLATVRNESGFRYNAQEVGNTSPYRGRGFIQITGDFNYGPAGEHLGVDLRGNPDLAATVQWAAPIARWYWTVARDINPAADRLDMAAVNVAIGYAPSAAEDAERCNDFKAALQYYNGGTLPGGINCTRGATAASSKSLQDKYARD